MAGTQQRAKVSQAVPFFRVSDMQASLRFYVDGLGFEIYEKWDHDGTIRWCWLRRDNVALMLQDLPQENGTTRTLDGTLGLGVSIMFLCDDAIALYRECKARGLQPSKPFVGNSMWVTSLRDPDGYRIEFESRTDAPEGSELDE